MEIKLNAGSARSMQRSNSTNVLKSNMSCVSQKEDIIQLTSETPAALNILVKDEIPDVLQNPVPGVTFSALVKIEAGPLNDEVTYGHMHGAIIEREEVSFEPDEDNLDHVPFKQRIMLLRIMSQNNESKNTFPEEPVVSGDTVLRGGQSSDAMRLRKRKKTATYVC